MREASSSRRGPPRGAGAHRRAFASLLPSALLLVACGPSAAQAAEYRDPEARFVITLPDRFQEVDRAILQARLAALRRGGLSVPAYQAAFDRGTEPRLSYPYALLEVVPVPRAAWTTADLEGLLGKLDTEHAAQDTAAAFDRLGLGSLMRDPRIAFVRWEPERQAALYRIITQAQGGEILGTGRIYFYRQGYLTLWFYYRAGTPYAEAAERFTAALTVLPAHRVPAGGFMAGARAVPIVAATAAAAMLVGLGVWLARRRRGPTALAALALALGLALGGCASAPEGVRTVQPGSLRCMPSGYGTVACY